MILSTEGRKCWILRTSEFGNEAVFTTYQAAIDRMQHLATLVAYKAADTNFIIDEIAVYGSETL